MINETFPKTQLEFEERFSTDEACYEYLASVRWPDGFVCPDCGHHGGRRRPGREEFVCGSKACKKKTSLRSGTVLHNSPKPLKAWIWAMFLMTTNKQSISALRLQQLTGFGCYRTALRWLRELRRAMSTVVEKQVMGLEVEVDETFVGHGKQKLQPNRPKTQVRIAGVVERLESGCGRARLKVITGEDKHESIQNFVRATIKPGAFIHSDGLAAYEAMADEGFLGDARAVSGKKGAARLENDTPKVLVHLPLIHRVFSLVMRVLIGAHQGACSAQHLQGYLDEYCFRLQHQKCGMPILPKSLWQMRTRWSLRLLASLHRQSRSINRTTRLTFS